MALNYIESCDFSGLYVSEDHIKLNKLCFETDKISRYYIFFVDNVYVKFSNGKVHKFQDCAYDDNYSDFMFGCGIDEWDYIKIEFMVTVESKTESKGSCNTCIYNSNSGELIFSLNRPIETLIVKYPYMYIPGDSKNVAGILNIETKEINYFDDSFHENNKCIIDFKKLLPEHSWYVDPVITNAHFDNSYKSEPTFICHLSYMATLDPGSKTSHATICPDTLQIISFNSSPERCETDCFYRSYEQTDKFKSLL